MRAITCASSSPYAPASNAGAAMSSSWIAPNDGAIWMTVSTKLSTSRVGIRMGTPESPTKRSSRAALPSITGSPACTPMLPRPRIAEPLVMMATVRPSDV